MKMGFLWVRQNIHFFLVCYFLKFLDGIQESDEVTRTWDFQQCGSSTSKGSDQPVHMHSLIRAFASRLNILGLFSYWQNSIWGF